MDDGRFTSRIGAVACWCSPITCLGAPEAFLARVMLPAHASTAPQDRSQECWFRWSRLRSASGCLRRPSHFFDNASSDMVSGAYHSSTVLRAMNQESSPAPINDDGREEFQCRVRRRCPGLAPAKRQRSRSCGQRVGRSDQSFASQWSAARIEALGRDIAAGFVRVPRHDIASVQ